MDHKESIIRIYEHLENDNLEKATFACLRIARRSEDYINAAVFLRELYPDRNAVADVLFDDTVNLNKDAQKFVWEKSLERWLDTHTMDFVFPGHDEDVPTGERRSVLKVAVGEIESDIRQTEEELEDMKRMLAANPLDTLAFLGETAIHKNQLRARLRALNTIKSRLKSRCLNYAIQVERQLDSQRKSRAFLEDVQNEVNNYFKTRSMTVYQKLEKAVQLSLSTDPEDFSLLLTEVRRVINSAADYFYPPIAGAIVCSDGKKRAMGNEQYLNRLQEFIKTTFAKSISSELLVSELDSLSTFIRRLNEVASKGIHSDASLPEARQGLIGVYFFLFNLCQRLTQSTENHTTTT